MLMPLSLDNGQGLDSCIWPRPLSVWGGEAGALSNQEAGDVQRDGAWSSGLSSLEALEPKASSSMGVLGLELG